MKNILFAVMATSFFASCKNENTTPQSNTADSIIAQQQEPSKATPLQQLSAQMGGTWVGNDYLTAIEKTKSVYANREYKTELYAFTLYRDSLTTGKTNIYGYSDHEGGYTWPITFSATSNRFAYDNERNREFDTPKNITLEPFRGNTMHFRYRNPAKMEVYRKISNGYDISTELDATLNRILFEGTYKDANGKTITFSRDGKTNLLGSNSHYKVQFDFGEGMDFDHIYLSNKELQGDDDVYHFKINGNTLNLYKITGDHEKMEYIIAPTPFAVLQKQ